MNNLSIHRYPDGSYSCNITELLSADLLDEYKTGKKLVMKHVSTTNNIAKFEISNDKAFLYGEVLIHNEKRKIVDITINPSFFKDGYNDCTRYIDYNVDACLQWF